MPAYQFQPFLDAAWNGSAKVVKAAPGSLLRLSVYNGNDEDLYVLLYDADDAGDLPEDPIDIVLAEANGPTVVEGGVCHEFINGIILVAAEAADGTGAPDTSILVSGRYM